MGTATFSVVTSITVLYLHHHGAESRPPKIFRFIAFKCLARAVCMRQQMTIDLDMHENETEGSKHLIYKFIQYILSQETVQGN